MNTNDRTIAFDALSPEFEAVLLEYIERYGLTDRARRLLVKSSEVSQNAETGPLQFSRPGSAS